MLIAKRTLTILILLAIIIFSSVQAQETDYERYVQKKPVENSLTVSISSDGSYIAV
jgi:predicted RND superfamily exporter protein